MTDDERVGIRIGIFVLLGMAMALTAWHVGRLTEMVERHLPPRIGTR